MTSFPWQKYSTGARRCSILVSVLSIRFLHFHGHWCLSAPVWRAQLHISSHTASVHDVLDFTEKVKLQLLDSLYPSLRSKSRRPTRGPIAGLHLRRINKNKLVFLLFLFFFFLIIGLWSEETQQSKVIKKRIFVITQA